MTSVIHGADNGRYPDGNALLVRGTSETILIDPTLTIAHDANSAARVDRVLISHCHEDHLAGLFKYANVPVHVHAEDRLGLQTLEGLMTIYGLPASIEAAWRDEVVTRFHYVTRPDAAAFVGGDVFELGGTTVHAIHLPGHTRGHSGFLVEPDGVMFLADVDLTGFGPYYGDAWSSLDAFERSIERCRQIEAATFVTFHHKGVVEGRATLRALLDAYEAVIAKREEAMLEFLAEPRTLDEMMARRFVYRPHVTLLFADAVERRSAELHVERFLARGQVVEVDAGRYRRR